MNHSIFYFFEELLEYDKYEEQKDTFIANYIEEYGSPINIDAKKGIIEVDFDTKYSFENNFNRKINYNYIKVKQEIDKGVIEIISKNIEPLEYLKLQLQILNSLELKAQKLYINTPIVKQALNNLKIHILDKYNFSLGFSENEKSDSNTLSPTFFWDSIDDKTTQKAITSLFDFLVSNNFISGSKKDFINGFTGKPVVNGIKWLLKTKDKKNTSKPSLFAFIDYLKNENFIKDIKGKDYNDAIKYVFRDFNGNPLKNIRQSKSSSTTEINIKIKEFINSIFT